MTSAWRRTCLTTESVDVYSLTTESVDVYSQQICYNVDTSTTLRSNLRPDRCERGSRMWCWIHTPQDTRLRRNVTRIKYKAQQKISAALSQIRAYAPSERLESQACWEKWKYYYFQSAVIPKLINDVFLFVTVHTTRVWTELYEHPE